MGSMATSRGFEICVEEGSKLVGVVGVECRFGWGVGGNDPTRGRQHVGPTRS